MREQKQIIAMTGFLNQQEIRPDLHTTLTVEFYQKSKIFC